jgi:hypothetical protein
MVTLRNMILELSRLRRPIRGSVLGPMRVEHLCALVRGRCGMGQSREALEQGFQWSLVRALCRMELCLPAGRDDGWGRELCEDVRIVSLPRDFVRRPFGVVPARVEGAVRGIGVSLAGRIGMRAWKRAIRSSFRTW